VVGEGAVSVSSRTENIIVFAKKLLNICEVKEPTANQVSLMKSLLTDIGVVFFELSFARHLTVQETTCLFWVAHGKSIRQIAELLEVHHATIKTYFQRIKQKLNCTTMEQAVFEGIRYCYIQPRWNRK
jgi:DNA-binding CsgD family transcriptional regulator